MRRRFLHIISVLTGRIEVFDPRSGGWWPRAAFCAAWQKPRSGFQVLPGEVNLRLAACFHHPKKSRQPLAGMVQPSHPELPSLPPLSSSPLVSHNHARYPACWEQSSLHQKLTQKKKKSTFFVRAVARSARYVCRCAGAEG